MGHADHGRHRLLSVLGLGLAVLLALLIGLSPQSDLLWEEREGPPIPSAGVDEDSHLLGRSDPAADPSSDPAGSAATSGQDGGSVQDQELVGTDGGVRDRLARVNAAYLDVRTDIQDLAIRIESLLEGGGAAEAFGILMQLQEDTYEHAELSGFFRGACLSFLPAVARADPRIAGAVTDALMDCLDVDEEEGDVYRRLAAMAALTGGPRYRESSIDDRWMVRLHLVRWGWNTESPIDRLQSKAGLIDFLPPENHLAQQLRDAVEHPGATAPGHHVEEWAMLSLAALGRAEDWPLIRDKGLGGRRSVRRTALDAAAWFPYEMTRSYLLSHLVDATTDEDTLGAAYGSLLSKASSSEPATRDLMDLLIREERGSAHSRVSRWFREEAGDAELAARLAAFYAAHPDPSCAAGMARYIISERRDDLYDLADAIVERTDLDPSTREALARDLAQDREGGVNLERKARLQKINRRLDVLFAQIKAMDRSDPEGQALLNEVLELIEQQSGILRQD